ncbi:MAG: tryptophan synthase subunit alpha [Deltaproteobacteria bacterium]|nr:tryptophan synthase subunit alpha [Deltaproteobacteria bacterium]
MGGGKGQENRIQKTFARLKAKGEKAFVIFITAGDPDIKTTKEIMFELEKSGADIIELGIPFSDPMADGTTIQAASERALKNGTTLNDVLKLVRDVRQKTEIPIILFGYYNPIFAYGVKRFAYSAKKAGADGVLVVDLPPEEADELKIETDKNSIDLIFLLTPTSDNARVKLVAEKASGFIYYVSVAGVTGARKNLASNLKRNINAIKRNTALPICVGFGISTREQVKKVSSIADGVVVGSAIVKLIAHSEGKKGFVKGVGSFVSNLKAATKGF